jgi:DNA-binding NtrC family response regulator
VLLVEDEAVLRDLISEMLSRKGYEVVTAPDAASAIARGEANDFDLLVTDVSMPGMSGVDLADALHRRSPGLGVLLISGYPRADLDASRLNSHIVFLAKPFSIEEVASAAREALDRRPRLL